MNNFWGSLMTAGNRVNSQAWSIMHRPIGTTLNDAGLMTDGATLWFSYVEDILNQNETNLDFNFALCNGNFSLVYAEKEQLLVATSEGIGVGNYRPFIRAAYWQDEGDGDLLAERVLSVEQYELDSVNNPRALIVGKIEWGATATNNETLTLYHPDKDRNLGTPFVNAWSIPALDQSLFDRISIQWKDSQPSIDEIRFGATASEVLPADLNAPLLVSTDPANNESQASGVYLVATFNEPITIGTGNITITDTAGPTTFTAIPVTDAGQVAVSSDGFSLVITPTALPTAGQTYYVEIDAGAVTDYIGNPFAGISGSSTWSYTVSTVAPTVVSIDGTLAATPVYGMPTIHYTATFDKYYMDDATVDFSDFGNAGSASISVGTVTRISDPLDAAVYAFDATPTSYGTVQLQVSGAISDVPGNALATPVNDDYTYVLDAGPEPPKSTITLDDFISINVGGTPKTFTFDASGSDKLVVVGTGEHNFGGTEAGSNYAGHALAWSTGLPVANTSFSFDTGLTDVLTVAAEFQAAELPKTGTVLLVR